MTPRAMRSRVFRSPMLWLFAILSICALAFELSVGLDAVRLLPWYQRPSFVVLLAFPPLIAGRRILAHHPAYNPAYFGWLGAVPWRPDRPLPLGPVLPTWADAVLIAALALLCALFDALGGPLTVLIAATATYSLLMLPVLSLMGLHMHAYAMAALVGIGLALGPSFPVIAGVSSAAFLIAVDGGRRSILRLPSGPQHALEFEPGIGAIVMGNSPIRRPREDPARLGFPYAALAPRGTSPVLSRPRAVVLPILAAWLLYAFFARQSVGTADPPPSDLGAMIGVLAAIMRVAAYMTGHQPPTSLFARLRNGTPIVPRYDIIFLAPLAAAVAGYLSWYVLRLLGAPPPLVIALPLLPALWIVLLAPPSLGRWDLTGAHRLYARLVQK